MNLEHKLYKMVEYILTFEMALVDGILKFDRLSTSDQPRQTILEPSSFHMLVSLDRLNFNGEDILLELSGQYAHSHRCNLDHAVFLLFTMEYIAHEEMASRFGKRISRSKTVPATWPPKHRIF